MLTGGGASHLHGRQPQRHHYVPKFILSPWVKEWRPAQRTLRGYYWDERANVLKYRDKGLDAFCFRLDLLTLRGQRERRALLETRFFQHIDDKGSQALAVLIARGPDTLSVGQRRDFARLLLSLDARRPDIVERLRAEAERYKTTFDSDPELLRAFAEQGEALAPSLYAERRLGWNFEDRAILNIQRLVDNPAIGGRLLNATWYLKRLLPQQGSLMISDRPLVRLYGSEHPSALWFLPLSPHAAFIAANSPRNVREIKKASGPTFVYQANRSSAAQADRYVFTVDARHETKLAEYLRLRADAIRISVQHSRPT